MLSLTVVGSGVENGLGQAGGGCAEANVFSRSQVAALLLCILSCCLSCAVCSCGSVFEQWQLCNCKAFDTCGKQASGWKQFQAVAVSCLDAWDMGQAVVLFKELLVPCGGGL